VGISRSTTVDFKAGTSTEEKNLALEAAVAAANCVPRVRMSVYGGRIRPGISPHKLCTALARAVQFAVGEALEEHFYIECMSYIRQGSGKRLRTGADVPPRSFHMPNTRDRTLTTSDALLLAILKQTPDTSYSYLQQQCGLSIGITHPALARLSAGNLVEIKPAKERKARAISLTRRGEEALEANWRSCLRAVSTPESMIRVVTLAALGKEVESTWPHLAPFTQRWNL
jgi:DNA-binding MarR family transcriptional regulator